MTSTGQSPAPLPSIRVGLSAEQVRERLVIASKRGRMPGFVAHVPGGLFQVAAHGHPFDAVMVGSHEGGRLTFATRMLMKLPVVFAVTLIITIWPGVYFMDLLIPGEWGWIPTWWWYLPITVLPIPWIWRGLMRRSHASINASALEMIQKIAAEVEGTIEGAAPGDVQPTPR